MEFVGLFAVFGDLEFAGFAVFGGVWGLELEGLRFRRLLGRHVDFPVEVAQQASLLLLADSGLGFLHEGTTNIETIANEAPRTPKFPRSSTLHPQP